MDEQDKRISQKVSGLDTPPPGTSWRPEQSWGRVQEQLQPEKAVQRQQIPWYYYAAAAFMILLVPFAVMLSDIRKQQTQIDQLAAQLEKEKRALASAERPLAVAKPVASGAVKPESAPAALKRVGNGNAKNTRAESVAREKANPPQKTPASGPHLVARQVLAVPPQPMEAAKEELVIGKNDSVPPLQIVISRPKRKANHVTLYFPGNGTSIPETEVAAATQRSRHKNPLRIFTRRPGGEDQLPDLTGSVAPVLSAKLK